MTVAEGVESTYGDKDSTSEKTLPRIFGIEVLVGI
jgi:hypothetical protein